MHLVFLFKIGPQILSYGNFNNVAQECIQWGKCINLQLNYSTRMYMVRWRYWSKTKIIVQECIWWGEGIDPKYFVSLLYISVAIKARLLKFSMFSVHKNSISNIFLEFFLTLKLLIWYRLPLYIFEVAFSGWGNGVDPKLFVSSCTR